MAQHQAEAVASAGLQVIQLPDASRTATTSSDTELWEYPMSVCLWETKEPRCISFHEQPSLVTPKDARELAAALLAAAAAAAAADDARCALADLFEEGYRHEDLDAARAALNVAIRHLQVHRRRHLSPVPYLPA